MAWYYKDADPHFGAWQAKDMQISMEDVLSNLPLEIIQGNNMVEVRHRAVSKARVLEKVLEFVANSGSSDAGEVRQTTIGHWGSCSSKAKFRWAWETGRSPNDLLRLPT